jgi:hypothetical protein
MLFTHPLEKRGCEGVDGRLRRFLVPPQRRSDYTDIQMKAAPLALAATVTYHRIILISCRKTASGSCRGVRRLAEKGIAGYAHRAAICDRVRQTPSPILGHPFPDPPSLARRQLSAFPVRKGRSRKANAQVPSPLFPFVEFHPPRCDRGVGTASEHARTPCKIASTSKTKQMEIPR